MLEVEAVGGGAGCRAMNAGTIIHSSIITSGRTGIRYGLRQTKEYTARNDQVCEGRFQLKSLATLIWNLKTMPILLNRQNCVKPL